MGSRLVTASIAVLLIIGQFTSPAWAYKRIVHVEGFISSIDSYGSSFTLDARRSGSGFVTVLVRENTALQPRVTNDDDEAEEVPFHRASIRDFREGDVVLVDGFALRGNRILAAQIGIRNRGYAGVPFPPTDPYHRFITQGVVTWKGAQTITIREFNGQQRTIFVPADARVIGDRASFAEIAINDRVRVDGVTTYDQSVVATNIAVRSGDGFRLSGRITFMSSYAAPPVLVLDNAFTVRVSPETQILAGGQARSLYDLRVGQAVTAMGTPIVASGIVVGVNAQLITY